MSHDNKVTVNTTLNNVVIIDSEQNQINVSHPVTQVIEVTAQTVPTVTVIEETPNQVTVSEPASNTVTVSANGPQGIQGIQGIQGPIGPVGPSQPFTNVGTSTWATTSSLQLSSSITLTNNTSLNLATSTGTSIQSLYMDPGNNVILKAPNLGDYYFYEGNTNVLARFVNAGNVHLGGTSATSTPTMRITPIRVGIALGSSVPSHTLDVNGVGRFTSNLLVTGSVYVNSSLYMNGNKQFNYGAFYDTATQTGIQNVSQSFQFRSSSYSSGVSIINDSRISVSHNGVYNIQFSAQIVHNGNQTEDIWIWLKKNGSNVPNSATLIRATKQLYTVAAWNFVEQINTTDYVEIAWQGSHNDMQVVAEPNSGNIPGIPSLILTVTQVA